jgi:uncharacterized protein (TIGR04255 family)
MATSPSVTRPPYNKPPIIEAVIALHFSTPMELKSIDAFALKSKTRFPHSEDMVEMSASFNPQANQSTSNIKKLGRKLSSLDGSRVIIILPLQFAVIQRAPYTEWDTLCGEAREHWNVLSKIIKHRALTHVSTRYINRVDIPVDTNGTVDLHKYFTVGLSLPPYAQSMALQAFHVNSSLLHPSGKYRYALQFTSITPSPLIEHMSFTVDIDLATTELIPQSEDKLWEFVGSLRQYKNELFESCITPETRELFQ